MSKIAKLLADPISAATAVLVWASIVITGIGFLGGKHPMKWSSTSVRVQAGVIVILGTILTVLLLIGAALEKGL